MFIRFLAIWVVCGAALFAILGSDPVSATASPAQLRVIADSTHPSPTEPQTVLAHLRCVAPVIEGRSLRTLMTAPDTTATKDYVMAQVPAELQSVGACGAIVLAASR